MADLPSDKASKPLTPEVTWAQRSSKDDAEKNFIWITILASDVPAEKMKLDLQPSSLKFAGWSKSKDSNYAVDLTFYDEIDPAASKVHHTARALELKLQKKEKKEEYWPRLLKDSKKMHFLRTDFDKWVDEDEQEAVDDDDYMNKFGGLDMGGDGGFGGLDFSKLGGGAGLGAGADDDEDDDGAEADDDDDDEMPGLEKESPPASGKKIEEVE